MSQTEAEKTEAKEAMKKLRAVRKETIKAAAARMKERKKAIKAIKEELRNKDKGGTVPEIAGATGIPSSEVMWYFAALKKYGQILEGEKDGGYFRYQWAGSAPEEPEEEAE